MSRVLQEIELTTTALEGSEKNRCLTCSTHAQVRCGGEAFFGSVDQFMLAEVAEYVDVGQFTPAEF